MGLVFTRPALPWTVRLKLFVLVGAYDLALRRDGTINRFLFSLGDRQTRASPRVDALGVRSADVTVNGSRGLWARVFSPARADSPAGARGELAAEAAAQREVVSADEESPLPVIVYTHGGGFALLSAASSHMDSMCRRFCREFGAVVVSVNYRLAPEHRHPAAYEDGVDVLRYLSNTGLTDDVSVPVDLSRCFLVGDSAGGNIAHHVAQIWTSSSPTSSPIRLAGIILLQPFFGGEERTEAEQRLEGVAPMLNMRRTDWSWRAFLPEGANRNHQAAHVTGQAGPDPQLAEAFPPAMVVIGWFDPLKDWQRRYADMLRRNGKAVQVAEFPDAFHGFYMFPDLNDSRNLLTKIRKFMENNASKWTARLD